MSDEASCGVQVVSVEADGSYRMCAEALRGVAARAELRGLPVAVVSVAGATRGGKSFLLDFFLRYLRAAPLGRADGSWLGAEDEPLSGFSWRGGCDRDTTGILLWSEPVLLTRGDGQKVVVLLMDTQGTFDSSSTIRDSVMVFAMSTLLSSVQIFNLSMNIQEDNLQYLQLFTEYGKLATAGDDGCKPFQTLQFLIRDWCYAYQHPTGSVGGQQLLDKRLQITDSQADELKEVRQHIQDSFESVRCFLMPHPGLTVSTNPNFKGCLADISTEFKTSLLDLVHGIFENLSFKKVNGQEIEIQDLAQYFESYMEVFNSDQLPNPVTILKATSSACLEAAVSAARELYVQRMERAGGGRSVPRDVMPREHAAAEHAARQAFLARRTLAAPEQAAGRLDRLSQELDHLFLSFVALNQAKVQESMAAAKVAYEKHMDVECMLPRVLEERHGEAVTLALQLFDDSRLPLEADADSSDEDEDRRNLQEELLKLYRIVQLKNDAKIKYATVAAKHEYELGFSEAEAEVANICVHHNDLLTMHRAAKRSALDMFDSSWHTSENAENEHRTTFLNIIDERFHQISSINTTNNMRAVEEASEFYEDAMHTILGTNSCLHPLDFRREERNCKNNAIAEFYRMRTYGNEAIGGLDNFKENLIANLSTRFIKFCDLNDERNNSAVKTAHELYETGMGIRQQNTFSDTLANFFGPPIFDMMSRQNVAKARAFGLFAEFRTHNLLPQAEDQYLDKLNKMIKKTNGGLVFKNVAKAVVQFGVPLAVPFLSFLRRA